MQKYPNFFFLIRGGGGRGSKQIRTITLFILFIFFEGFPKPQLKGCSDTLELSGHVLLPVLYIILIHDSTNRKILFRMSKSLSMGLTSDEEDEESTPIIRWVSPCHEWFLYRIPGNLYNGYSLRNFKFRKSISSAQFSLPYLVSLCNATLFWNIFFCCYRVI